MSDQNPQDPNMQDAFGAAGRKPGEANPYSTITEAGMNPAKFVGTNQDPIERPLTFMETRNYGTKSEAYSGAMVWWAFYLADPEGARAAFLRHYKAPLDEAKLTKAQRKKIGLAPYIPPEE